jgi:hypothetical protein
MLFMERGDSMQRTLSAPRKTRQALVFLGTLGNIGVESFGTFDFRTVSVMLGES